MGIEMNIRLKLNNMLEPVFNKRYGSYPVLNSSEAVK